MSQKRGYEMLCPIARALDHVGSRWTLLILRELHAGPARFRDLQLGLPGIASNLLASRLKDLQASGLIRQDEGEFGMRLYELTELGERSDRLLGALADWGAGLAPEPSAQAPSNLRLLGVRLKLWLKRLGGQREDLALELFVDEQPFDLKLKHGRAAVRLRAAPEAELSLVSSLPPLLELLDGKLGVAAWFDQHVKLQRGEPSEFLRLAEELAARASG